MAEFLFISVLFVCLCWGLTSQSTIFQSCRDGATASWVINQYFRGVKCLAQGHNTAAVGFEPPTSRSGVRHSTTEPPRSPLCYLMDRLLKLTAETNLTSILNNRFITVTNVWVWAWNQKPWCTDVQRHMHCGEDAEVKSRHLSPTIPRVTNDLCKKRTFVYKSAFFH